MFRPRNSRLNLTIGAFATAAFVLTASGPSMVAAQEADSFETVEAEIAEDAPQDTHVPPEPEDTAPVVEDDAAQCQRERRELADVLASMMQETNAAREGCEAQITAATAQSVQELQFCQSDENQNRRTNVALNNQLAECNAALAEAGPEPDPNGAEDNGEATGDTTLAPLVIPGAINAADYERALEEVAALRARTQDQRTQNAALTQEIDRLGADLAKATLRLEEFGVGLEPAFSYFGDDPFDSFLYGSEVITIISLDELLTVADCGDGLAWLPQQSGADRSVDTLMWAREGANLVVCSVSEDTIQATAATPVDEAHLLLFR